MMKKFCILLTIILSFTFARAFCQTGDFPKEKLVQIAIQEFQKLGGKLSERRIIYDIDNGIWESKRVFFNKEMVSKLEVLSEKNYQAICFVLKPRPSLKGKNTWVFVDKMTGEVLVVYVEE